MGTDRRVLETLWPFSLAKTATFWFIERLSFKRITQRVREKKAVQGLHSLAPVLLLIMRANWGSLIISPFGGWVTVDSTQ